MAELRGRGGTRKPKLLDAEGLWDYSLKLLGMRALSSGELRAKLRLRAVEPGDIDGVVAKLREYKYIDDSKFAENFANVRRDSQGFGKFRVMRDLQHRKVASGVAEKAVSAAFSEVDEVEMAEQFLLRKFRNVKLHEYLQEDKHLAAAYRRLRYAGYASAVATKVLKKFSSKADELQDTPEE